MSVDIIFHEMKWNMMRWNILLIWGFLEHNHWFKTKSERTQKTVKFDDFCFLFLFFGQYFYNFYMQFQRKLLLCTILRSVFPLLVSDFRNLADFLRCETVHEFRSRAIYGHTTISVSIWGGYKGWFIKTCRKLLTASSCMFPLLWYRFSRPYVEPLVSLEYMRQDMWQRFYSFNSCMLER